MSLTNATIVNCKRASIRKAPWITPFAEDIVETMEQGRSIAIDQNEIAYDWTGRKFYKVPKFKGWIYDGCIDLGDDTDG